MIRSVQVSGTLAGDPEMRKAGQKEVASGRLAVSQGRDKPTIWFDLTAWGQYQGEALMRCRKGTRLVVAGRLNLRQWTDRNGQTRDNLGIDIDSIEAPRAPEGGQFEQRVATAAARYDDAEEIPF